MAAGGFLVLLSVLLVVKQNPCELVSSHQDAGGVGPGLVPHAPEQHRVLPAARSRPSSPAQTLPHC